MRVVFMGTPEFSVPVLEYLADEHEVVGVFTQPDRRGGRGKKWLPPPVKTSALERGIPVHQPERIKTAENEVLLRELAPDVIIVVAYGQIISQTILDIPAYGCINVHASLLPVLRGASPINMAIVRGHGKTGVTTMKMDAGLDTGDMLIWRSVPIGPEMTAGDLHDVLMHLGVEVLKETLENLDTLEPVPQDDSRATYAPILTRTMALVDWSKDAGTIHDLVRGFNPWPVAYTRLKGERLKIYRTAVMDRADTGHAPGTVLECSKNGLIVQTGSGLINLIEIQAPGSKRMLSSAYALGHDIPEMTVFEGE